MALAKCGKCGSELAPQAAACAQCGTPVSKPGLSTNKILLIVFGSLGMCCFGTCALGAVGSMASKSGGSQPTASATSSASASARWVELSTLLDEYRDNEVRADSSFKARGFRPRATSTT